MALNGQLIHKDQSDVIVKIGESLYLNEEMADFHFVFEIADDQYERISAHKLLLMTASDVFRTMFNGSWEEIHEVEIVDASVDEFKEFLQFFYLEKVTVSMGNLAKVMYLGDKYNITKCLNVCEKFIINTMKEDNFIWAYELATIYHQANLKKYCETFIAINAKAILSSSNFLECDSKVLRHILKLDSLSCPENEIFEACMNWVKATAKVDQLTREVVEAQLGDLFYDIRFKSMTPQEFAVLLPAYGDIFSSDEYKEIAQTVALQEFQPKIFNENLRTPFGNIHFNEEASIDCHRKLAWVFSYRPYHIKSIENTRFSTNTPLLLSAFECCKLCEYKNKGYLISNGLPTDITILQIPDPSHSSEGIVLHNEKYHLLSKQRTCVALPKPLLIRPGFMYDIRMKQSPSENDCTGSLLKAKVEMESNIIVQFHGDPIDEGDTIPRGMICKLKFCRILN